MSVETCLKNCQTVFKHSFQTAEWGSDIDNVPACQVLLCSKHLSVCDLGAAKICFVRLLTWVVKEFCKTGISQNEEKSKKVRVDGSNARKCSTVAPKIKQLTIEQDRQPQRSTHILVSKELSACQGLKVQTRVHIRLNQSQTDS